MFRTPRTRRLGAIVLAAAALSLSACSSDDSDEDTAAPAAGGDCPGLEDATSYLEESQKNPTGVGYDLPLTKPVPTGKSIVALETPVPVAKATNDVRDQTAKLLGWKSSRIVVEGTPEGPASAMDVALDRNPDAVFYSGYDPSSMSAGLKRAVAEKVPVIAESVPNNQDPAIVGVVRDEVSNDRLGKMAAAFVVADSDCDANVEAWSVPSQPIVTTFQDSFDKYLAEWCPDCTVNVNDYEFSDIGTNVPGMVVSALQTNPDANYVIFGYGESILGLEPALATAGLTEQVKIGGAIPGPDQFQSLRDGTNAFWAVDSGPNSAWRETDMMVRALAGEDLAPVQEAELPAQLLTADNIEDAAFDPSDYWIGYDGFEKDYKAMWGLS